MQDPNIKICLPPVSNQDWQASFLEYITSTIFKTGRILKENKKWKLRKLEKVGCATTGLLFKKLAWVSGSMPVETLLRFSRKRVLHNLWVRQVVISWLDIQWWYLMMMANSLELLVQVEHFSSPFFFFYMSNLNRLHYHPFLPKMWLIKAFTSFFVLYILSDGSFKKISS